MRRLPPQRLSSGLDGPPAAFPDNHREPRPGPPPSCCGLGGRHRSEWHLAEGAGCLRGAPSCLSQHGRLCYLRIGLHRSCFLCPHSPGAPSRRFQAPKGDWGAAQARVVPGRNQQLLLQQTLVSSWPWWWPRTGQQARWGPAHWRLALWPQMSPWAALPQLRAQLLRGPGSEEGGPILEGPGDTAAWCAGLSCGVPGFAPMWAVRGVLLHSAWACTDTPVPPWAGAGVAPGT